LTVAMVKVCAALAAPAKAIQVEPSNNLLRFISVSSSNPWGCGSAYCFCCCSRTAVRASRGHYSAAAAPVQSPCCTSIDTFLHSFTGADSTRAACRECASVPAATAITRRTTRARSEEHTSELQSRENLVCRLL